MAEPKILLVQLEFPTWAQAKAWSYGGNFGVEEGLRANGCDCVTLPALSHVSDTSPQSWLYYAKALLAGQRFDQVWVWLVHNRYSEGFLEWVAGLAPVRVGLVMESLRYSEDDCRRWPHLRERLRLVEGQVRYMTHVLAADERDAGAFNEAGHARAVFWPQAVPARFITSAMESPVRREAAFYGELYGERNAWLAHPRLKDVLVRPASAETGTELPGLFDALHQQVAAQLQRGWRPDQSALIEYVDLWRQLRGKIFAHWLVSLKPWSAIVNLPSLFQAYAGRVVETMAAGRPAVSWEIPDRPITKSLFRDGREILLYPRDRPSVLADHLAQITGDPSYAQELAASARAEVLRVHTAEHRAQQLLSWIQTGHAPQYQRNVDQVGTGIERKGNPRPQNAQANHRQEVPATTVFVLTVDDPAFPACLEALQKQERRFFQQKVIRHVSPFSAAAQKMITDCVTEFFVQVDEDMILHSDAVATMEAVMRDAPDDVGMICFHLYDEDRGGNIQGVKIYRTSLMKELSFRDRKASEMDLLEQMGQLGIKWLLHPDVKGRHGTLYTPETIYRRYKTMYEKDIRTWNTMTWDLKKKAEKFRETGDQLQLFALLGAAHGIINAPHAQDQEKDFRTYDLKELEVFKRLCLGSPPPVQPYDTGKSGGFTGTPPVPFDQVQWKTRQQSDIPPSLMGQDTPKECAMTFRPRSQKKTVLIVTPHFWPSVGGVERAAEMLGVGLVGRGYRVEVAAYPENSRISDSHRGITIITLARPEQIVREVSAAATQIAHLLSSGRYDTCIMMGDPRNALFYGGCLQLCPTSPSLIIQPTMNAATLEGLKEDRVGHSLWNRLATQATAVIRLSETGYDACWFNAQGVSSCLIPNGTTPVSAKTDFRGAYGIPHDVFVILHVANLYTVKNHLGLLRALGPLPRGSRLVLIGHETNQTDYVKEVRRVLAGRTDVLFIPGLPSEGVAAAMQSANLLVLASHTEVAPLCIVEAMSHRLPWLATPSCGNVTELTGGVVAPLEEFPVHITRLMAKPELGQALGSVGYMHWDRCFRWDGVLEGWIDIIETGHLRRSYTTPPELVAQSRSILHQLGDGQPDADSVTGDTSVTILSQGESYQQCVLSEQPQRSPKGTCMDSDTYYVNMFVKHPGWSTSEPNSDEAARWSKIASFLEYVLRQNRAHQPGITLRIIEVGCGRGWLSKLASLYGTVEGVEPVAGVIDYARKLFPGIRFESGTADDVLARSDFQPYDVVLCSEVIEHIPYVQKEHFVRTLNRLLKPGGYLIMTTPRGEMWDRWQSVSPPSQPVEEWVTEAQLEAHLRAGGFVSKGLERIHVELPSLRYIPAPTPHELRTLTLIPIYQVWLAQAGSVETGQLCRLEHPVPKVSVIIPTHNRPDRLKAALNSVLRQTFQDFEILVVNDGTIPVEWVVSELNVDGRITLIGHDRNRGLAASRNTGLRHARGKYVCYLDDDDRFLPEHLATLIEVLEREHKQVAYTDAWRVHETLQDGEPVEINRDRPYSQEFHPIQLLIGNYIPVLCVMHARTCLDEIGLFDESLFVHEDWDLWIRMATRYPFVHIPRTTAEYTWRTDGSSMTSRDQDAFLRTTEIIYHKYAPHVAQHPPVRRIQAEHLAKLRERRAPASFSCSIVIPVHNQLALTKQCLEALVSATNDVSYEVIVVDNGSTDGTPEFLASLGGDVQIISNQTNLGFAKACNQGARKARGKYVVFLNNDTIPQPGWLGPLVSEVEEHSEVGIVGSKLLYQDGSIQHAGVAFTRSHLTPYHVYKSASGTDHHVNQRREFQAVTAACMLIRREMFEELQGFDERFLNGLEDVDLCLRAREKGCRIIYQPRSVVYHLENQTPGRKDNEERNDRLFTERWGSQWWLGDQDLHYYHDRKKLVGCAQDTTWATELSPLSDTLDRAAWAHVAAAQAAALKKDWVGVKRELQMGADWPNDRFVLAWGAMVAERLQEPGYRAEFLARQVALVDEPAKRLELIRLVLEQNNLQVAEEQLRLLLSVSPDHAEGLLLQGILCMQRGQYEPAETAFGSALRQGGERRKCLMGMGMAAMGRAYSQGAWERFLEVLTEHPDDVEAIHWLLRAGTAQNRWRELGEQLHPYVLRNPGDIASRFAYASVLLRAEQTDAARREYDALLRVAPTYDGLEQLGRAISGREAVLTMEPASS